ncbi:MAG: glycogen synthase [Candidatus Omnitrophica bacterium]|nr:glycogen synthase [Candidatus Omnitrophota bacterium]
MVVSEVEPFSKTGGLADVAGALPKALAAQGVQTHLFTPRYACVGEKKRPSVRMSPGFTVHFIDHPQYFAARPHLYGGADGDYPDNLDRFSFFCRESLSRMKKEGIRPDLLHAHDWQGALSIVYLEKGPRRDPFFSKTKTVLTIHNLAYQGIFPKEEYPKLGLPWGLFSIEGLEFYGKVNLLKGGIAFGRALTTVSPTYAREIQNPDFGEGLDGILRVRSSELTGILNGIDVESWDPSKDRSLPARFDPRRLSKKSKVKAALQKEVGFPVDSSRFLIGMVSRLASQKGMELVIQALPRLEALGIQLVILGSGDKPIQEALRRAAAPSLSVRLRLAFDLNLARRIYAGADAFLMPSRYEPCGLGQMISMRYGTVPIVRATGGLNDTVRESGPGGNGFCFGPYQSGALVEALKRALSVYREKPRWEEIQRRGMTADFSWKRSAGEYLQLYRKLIFS